MSGREVAEQERHRSFHSMEPLRIGQRYHYPLLSQHPPQSPSRRDASLSNPDNNSPESSHFSPPNLTPRPSYLLNVLHPPESENSSSSSITPRPEPVRTTCSISSLCNPFPLPALYMPTPRVSRRAHNRLSNPSSPESTAHPAGPSTKRQKRNDGTVGLPPNASSSSSSGKEDGKAPVEEISLVDETSPLESTLQKQRADAIKSQTNPSDKPMSLSSLTCVICMDTPTDLTATSCGHIFCHTCLMEALIAGENRAAPGEPKRSQCPVCRKIISRTKQADIIPLLIKKGLATQPRKVVADGTSQR